MNIRDQYNETPLHRASCYGCIDRVSLLLSHGAEVMVKNYYNNTAYHLACGALISESKRDRIIYGRIMNPNSFTIFIIR